MDTTAKVQQRGQIILPAELRRKYRIQPGDTFRLVDREGMFVLMPSFSIVPSLNPQLASPSHPPGESER